MMHDIDITNRREQRKFGLTMAAAFFVITAIRWGILWLRTGDLPGPPIVLPAIGAAFLVLGLAVPVVLFPVFWAWIRFALALNWLVTRILLTIAFVFLITPMRALVSLFSSDPLKRAWRPDLETYWEEPEAQPDEFERYRDQF